MPEIKELIEKAVDLLAKDENLMENFKKDPIKTVEKLFMHKCVIAVFIRFGKVTVFIKVESFNVLE